MINNKIQRNKTNKDDKIEKAVINKVYSPIKISNLIDFHFNSVKSIKIIKTSDTTFTIKKNCFTYLITILLKENTIDINLRMHLSPNHFEGIFTIDDFYTNSRLFYIYDKLCDIHEFIINKLTKEDFDIIEEEAVFILEFIISYESRREKVFVKLLKIPDSSDINCVFDDLCKTVLLLSENYYLEERIKNFELNQNELYKSEIVKNDEINMICK
jgi:hypothetical protein